MATAGYAAGVETNAVVLSYAAETAWGTLPSVAFKALRLTSESLSGQKTRQRPSEINATRQASAAITTQESAGGQISFALSYGTFDDLFAGLLGDDWSTPLAIDSAAGDISTVATGNKLTSTTAGKFTAIAVGQWIKLSGFAAGANTNNGWYRISAKTSAQDITLAGKTVTNETPAGTAAKIRGSMLRNGVNFQSFYVQKQVGAGQFLRYPGSYVTAGSIAAALGQPVSGSFTLASQQEMKATTDASTGAITAAPAGRVHDTVAGLGTLQMDDAAIAATVESFSLDLTNEGAAAQYGLGSAAAAGMLGGTFTGAGRLRTFFKDFTLYDRFKSEAAGRIAFRTADDTGAGYVFTGLNTTIVNPQIVAGGPGQAVMAEFALELNPDATTGKTLQIDRAPAA
jgi:hypothetical protein